MDLVDLVVECLPSPGCGCVIDVGCGDGQLIRKLSARLHPTLCVGADVDISCYPIGGGVHGVCANAVFLPFRDRRADVVTARGLLHHVDDVEAVIGELSRVVAPHGWLFISDATRFDDATFADMNRQLQNAGMPTERHPGFEPDRLAQSISRVGLSVTQMVTSGEATFATPPFVSHIYSTPRLLIAAQR